MTKTELPLLVLGATGGQGGAVVDALLERDVASNDVLAMRKSLQSDGYQVDVAALHASHRDVGWTSFANWAVQTMGVTA